MTETLEKVIAEEGDRASSIMVNNPNSIMDDLVYKDFDEISPELKQLNQWVLWKKELNSDGKPTKVPYHPRGFKVSSKNPKNWSGFELVLKNHLQSQEKEKPFFDGIGFVFSENDDYCGIDLDHCRDDSTGEVEDWAKNILDKFSNTYVELSPSRTGFHIICKARLQEDGKHKGSIDNENHIIEIYDRGRYFTVTGLKIDSSPSEIMDCQKEAESLQERIIKSDDNKNRLQKKLNDLPQNCSPLIDSQIIDRLKDDLYFRSLFYDGDKSKYTNNKGEIDDSKADYALAKIISSLATDPGQIKRIMLSSKINREKWHDRSNYLDDTIDNAIKEKSKRKSSKPIYALIEAIRYLISKDNEARLVYTSLGKPYLWINSDDHFEMMELSANNKKFKKFCFRLVKDLYGLILIDDETFKKALLAIECAAEDITREKGYDLNPPELGYRRTWFNDAVWYDLCNDNWNGIQIDKNGYRKVPLPAIFLRRGNESPQIEPIWDAKPEEIDRLFKYVNVTDMDKRLLIKTWVCSAFVPKFKNRSLPQPLLSFSGVSGSGKTISAKFIKTVVDPSMVDARRLPENPENLSVILNNNGLIVFDNVGRKIPREISDLLCIDATKGYDTKRKLYTDDEEAALRLDSSVIFTSIQIENMNNDLINRFIFIETQKFGENQKRKRELELKEEFEKDLPYILGGIFSSISKALGIYDELENIDSSGNDIRMADFAIFGEALSRAWNNENMKFFKVYNNMQGTKTLETIQDNPTLTVLVEYIKNKKEYYGPLAKLLEELKELYRKKDSEPNLNYFVATGNGLSRKLKECDSVLASMGINVLPDSKQTNGKLYYRIRYAPNQEQEK